MLKQIVPICVKLIKGNIKHYIMNYNMNYDYINYIVLPNKLILWYTLKKKMFNLATAH